ncbi:MAG: hypothetical protein RBU21_21640 [FCB group bacterium]|nr:hypothetical protein [FCB group bacterium]
MKDFVYRLAVRLFLPHLHESLKQEDAASVFKAGAPEYAVVEDRGSDKTIFSFAGAAMLYAGMPAFEFRKMLRDVAEDYNLVFYRDVYRMLYHVGPQGQPDGLAFYQADIRRIADTLGSRHNVSIGASAGAGAAVYFGTQCGFNKILSFNQPLPTGVWSDLSAQFGNYCNIKKLAQYPGEYAENALISLAATWMQGQLRRAGIQDGWDPFALYASAPQRPPMTVFYGARCNCDSRNAERLRSIPEAKLVPLPIGLHNCATHLKRQNTLAETIRAELEDVGR